MSSDKIKNAITAVLALGISCTGAGAVAETKSSAMDMGGDIPGMEKCYGIAKKGMNDCGTTSHNCAGEAKQDADKNEWVRVPSGLCKKIVGGNTASS